jgi:hypothetical protein
MRISVSASSESEQLDISPDVGVGLFEIVTQLILSVGCVVVSDRCHHVSICLRQADMEALGPSPASAFGNVTWAAVA